MAIIWKKPDGCCHHCKETLPPDYICLNCNEWNGWEDPKYGIILSFFIWIGRRHF